MATARPITSNSDEQTPNGFLRERRPRYPSLALFGCHRRSDGGMSRSRSHHPTRFAKYKPVPGKGISLCTYLSQNRGGNARESFPQRCSFTSRSEVQPLSSVSLQLRLRSFKLTIELVLYTSSVSSTLEALINVHSPV